MLKPANVIIDSGRLLITIDASSERGMTARWCSWAVFDAAQEPLSSGVFQLAGHVPGDVVCIIVPAEAVNAKVLPMRNITPYPMAHYRQPQLHGAWLLTGQAHIGTGGLLGLRVISDVDRSCMAIKKLASGGDFELSFRAKADWSVIELLVERPGIVMSIEGIELVHMASGNRAQLLFDCSKANAKHLSGDGSKFVFESGALPWSYFTCWPVPL